MGIPYCDLLFFPGCRHVQVDEVLADPSGSARVVSRRVESAGLQVADTLGVFGSYRDLSPTTPDPQTRRGADRPSRACSSSRTGLAHGVTIVPGMDWPGETHESALARSGDEFAWRADRAADAAALLSSRMSSRSPNPSTTRLCTLAPGLTGRARLLPLGLPRHPPSGDRAPSPGHRAPTRPAGCAGSTAGLVTHRLDRFCCIVRTLSAASTVSASSTAATHTTTWIGSIPSPRRFAFGISSFAFEKAFLQTRPMSASPGTEAMRR